MSKPSLYTIGNLTIDDIVLWPDGQTWMGQAGGNVLFSAIGARVWLKEVGLLARLGSDYPAQKLDEMRARGIHPGLSQSNAPTLHDWALYEAHGGRQFINHINSGSNQEATLDADEITAEDLHGKAYHLAPVPTEQQAKLVDRLRTSDRLISLDPHESWIIGHEKTLQAVLKKVDFFLPSRLEAQRLYGIDAPERAVRAFAELGPRAVVIKLGADGSLIFDARRGQSFHVPPYPADVRDTTGAGDAYCGGFLAGYLLTEDPLTAAQYGTVAASYVIEAIGALSTIQPSRADSHDRLVAVAENTVIHTSYNEVKNGLQQDRS